MAQEPALFRSIPNKSCFSYNEDYYQTVIDSLGFSRKDVSLAAKVDCDSVRYDKKMPKELEDRIREWGTLIELVAEHFNDKDKAILWIKMPNHLLGGISPRDMIRLGRFKKLHQFVMNALSQNLSR